jgi:hypothetical protein
MVSVGHRTNATILATGLMILLLLGGCSTMSVTEYQDRTPELKPEEYFDGHVKAWGIFEDRNGKVSREFTGDFHGTWDGDKLVIDETLEYRDGTVEERQWTFDKTGENTYDLRAESLSGERVAKTAGNAMHLKYSMAVDVDGSTWTLSSDDWMYRQDEKTVINRATLSWWWFKAGELTIVYRKVN